MKDAYQLLWNVTESIGMPDFNVASEPIAGKTKAVVPPWLILGSAHNPVVERRLICLRECLLILNELYTNGFEKAI
ncbi:hypothetical protein [Advenella sp. FME57]|uniref:hypothetical protein n=1 Tax=Advenella sp. FME57 TaxID=2742604 RepID=UPI00186738B1|nr:hypothetical protein [Advenella sp. FME57]